ncbi:hypothetical protein [Ketobacter alkanivorans]|uniref:Uncharacterized protein n=1 Tax=Ketobacter alkanivorans TaxID=1917421 RepID=A0A2K9LGI2_9GAMM|nr:hypothetical protein [Ketobacter alkanivorans]AUM11468.1 hypothetical protein Kalk_03085 [Ketobacter alkanivorans]MCP5019539.1 hypothetical protein [Ketobacter sp.]
MVYVIIALAMLFILGPVLMLRPSARERREARIRQRAMADSVLISPISLARDKKFNALKQRNPHIDDFRWFRYQLVATEKETGPSVKGEWLQRKTREGQLVWEPTDTKVQTPPAVQQLIDQWQQQQAEDFLSLELGPRSVSIVWNERGDLAEVEALLKHLKQLLAI